jgi:hypothetical protein
MKVKVERLSSFKNLEGGTLRYTEHSPYCHEEDHQICNCTKNVKDRPLGEPVYISQDIILTDTLENMSVEYSFRNQGFTFKWEGQIPRSHAYFWFNDDRCLSRRLYVEVTVPGYGPVDHFFGHVFFGNDVDISKLLNGHAPSKIIDLKSIEADQIWAHACNWGGEAIEMFNRGDEADTLWGIKDSLDRIKNATDCYSTDKDISVDELRLRIEQKKEILFTTRANVIKLKSTIDNLKNTELYRCCDLAETNSKIREKELSEIRRKKDEEAEKLYDSIKEESDGNHV